MVCNFDCMIYRKFVRNFEGIECNFENICMMFSGNLYKIFKKFVGNFIEFARNFEEIGKKFLRN